MPAHTPHREKCRNCECPQGNHLHSPIDNLAAKLCSCFCHQYCDCEICLPKKENINPRSIKFKKPETFDPNCLKTEEPALGAEFGLTPENYKELHGIKKYNGDRVENKPTDIVIGSKVFCNGKVYITTGYTQDRKNLSLECEILEDPEVCHACDCTKGMHNISCTCSCHINCVCLMCERRRNQILASRHEKNSIECKRIGVPIITEDELKKLPGNWEIPPKAKQERVTKELLLMVEVAWQGYNYGES